MTQIKQRQLQWDNKTLAISCVIPFYNEQAHLISLIEALQTTLKTLTEHYEILFIDDGSTDHSSDIIMNSTEQSVKLLQFSRNFGKEAALMAGLQHSQGQVVIMLDADFQHPLSMLKTFIEHWVQGYDMVYGIRDRQEEHWLKRHTTHGFYRLMKYLTHVPIPANAGDFRLLDRTVVEALLQCTERNLFMKGLYGWVGFKQIGIPFSVAKRKSGTTRMRYKDLTELALTGITSFSNVPLRIWGIIGLIISCIAFGYGSFIIVRTLCSGVDVPGFATIVVSILFIGGVQLLSIGILGEYLARIFIEVKKRPRYLIQRKIGFDGS